MFSGSFGQDRCFATICKKPSKNALSPPARIASLREPILIQTPAFTAAGWKSLVSLRAPQNKNEKS